MKRSHTCPNCKYRGQIFLPENATETIITCPGCGKDEDVAYLLRTTYSLEELERREYERLKKKYGREPCDCWLCNNAGGC